MNGTAAMRTWRTSLIRLLLALMLLAALAPAISRFIHAYRIQDTTPLASGCEEHRHDAGRACEGSAPSSRTHSHDADGVHCPFCLLAQHVPVLPPVESRFPVSSVASGSASAPGLTPVFPHDHASLWMRQHKQGPPAV